MFSAIRQLWNSRPAARHQQALIAALAASFEATKLLLDGLLELCEEGDRVRRALLQQRSELEEAAEALAFTLLYGDHDEEHGPVSEVARWKRFRLALEEEHSGDCTDEPHSCARCQAEHVVSVAVRFAIVVRDFNSPPNPGSDEAVALGCRCPRLDNAFGDPERREFNGWVITEGCPVHVMEVTGGIRSD